MGKRHPGTVQFEVWITPEASAAINRAAISLGVSRGRYMQQALAAGLDPGERDMDALLPEPTRCNVRYEHLQTPKVGYRGRWSRWVRVRCTVQNCVPMMLTRQGADAGFGSASSYARHLLAIAIKEDTGLTVPMPRGQENRSPLFNEGKINQDA